MFNGLSKNITLNSKNNVGPNNNTYVYNFQQGALQIDDNDNLNIGSLILPNSVANVSSSYNNNQFAYIMSGLPFYGGSNYATAFVSDGIVSNSNTFNITIYAGIIYIGYAITITGLTGVYYVTNIVYDVADTFVGNLHATITLDQSISSIGLPSNLASGTAYIVGNKMLVSIVPPVANISYIPKVNMYLPPTSFAGNNFNLFNYITAVDAYPNISGTSSSLILITLKNAIPYSSLVNELYTTSYDKYINWVDLPTGYYDVPALNTALHQTMYNNGHYYFKNTTGSTNATIIYPQSIVCDTKKYGIYTTNTEAQPIIGSSLTTKYGSNITYNNIIIQNGSFSDFPISTNSYFLFPTYQLNPFLLSVIYSGGLQYYVGNGTNSLVLVSPPVPQYILYSVTSGTVGLKIAQDFYGYAGTYTWSFSAYMKNADATIQIRTSINGVFNSFTPVAGAWTTFTFTNTISSSINSSIEIEVLNILNVNNVAITAITAVNTTPIGVNWVNGYENVSSSPCQVFLNVSQSTAGYSVSPNKYSLGYMGVSSTDLFSTIPTTATYTMPYGIGMNFIYGAIIRCNLVENTIYVLTDILDALPFIYSFGSNTTYYGDEKNLIKLRKGRYNNITIQICDQNGNPLILLDNNVLLSFRISKRII